MKEKLIIENNNLIARFMGYHTGKIGNNWYVETAHEEAEKVEKWAKYHLSFDWLMPVVEKIQSITTEFLAWRIKNPLVHPLYDAVVIFIKCYNEQKIKDHGKVDAHKGQSS